MEEKQYIEEPVQEVPSWGEQVCQTKSEPYRMPYADSVYEEPNIPVYPKKAKRTRKAGGSKVGRAIVCVVLAILLVASSSVVTALLMNRQWENRWNSMNVAMNDKYTALQEQIDDTTVNHAVTGESVVLSGDLLTPDQVYAANVDAVVSITGYIEEYNMFGQGSSYASFGSGFIISADGYVVSNYHVVQGTQEISVDLISGDTYTAELVGFDEDNDIALLKVDAQDLPYTVLGSSTELAVGDQVVAIGSSLGDPSTLTVGYVSAKDRLVNTDGVYINMIQTDVAINSGSSGGPLFNMYGEVVGITTAKFSGSSRSGVAIEGVSFAIPMDDVIGMIEDLRDLGYVTGAYLGVMVLDVDATAQAYGLPAGACVEEVTPGYAAERAGLCVQDIIIDLGGYEITSVTELTRMLRKFEPGETVSITVYRAGQEIQLSITLDEKPRDLSSSEPEYLMPGDEGFEEWYEEFIDDYFG